MVEKPKFGRNEDPAIRKFQIQEELEPLYEEREALIHYMKTAQAAQGDTDKLAALNPRIVVLEERVKNRDKVRSR